MFLNRKICLLLLAAAGCSDYAATISSKINCRNDAATALIVTVTTSESLPKDYGVPAGASRRFLHVGRETSVTYSHAEYSVKIVISDEKGKQRGFFSKNATIGSSPGENSIVFPDGKKGLREFDIVCNDTACTLNGQSLTADP